MFEKKYYEAQPVYYNGYKTNSKLEARYMVLFDSLGIEYKYEPEVFRCANGILYRPDFELLNVKTNFPPWRRLFCEIKGASDFQSIKIEDQAKILTFAEDYPILVFGNLPDSVMDVFTRDVSEEQDIFALYYKYRIYHNVFFEVRDKEVVLVNKNTRSEPCYKCDLALAKARIANFNII